MCCGGSNAQHSSAELSKRLVHPIPQLLVLMHRQQGDCCTNVHCAMNVRQKVLSIGDI